MSEEDRRVRKTKKALREGLAELMLKKELRNITVKELSDIADIHRATFYTHYTDIYDLYTKLEDNIIDEMCAIIVEDTAHTYNELFQTLVDYIYNNTKICRMLLNPRRDNSFRERICELLERKYNDIWKYETGQNEISEEWRFLARYHIQGCIAIIERWAENGFSHTKDKIAELIIKADANFDNIWVQHS
jgi:AcrR family transcriptional regulator